MAGFATAVVIYFVNAAPDDASGYRLEDSKKYVREMEIYGGKMNLLASELGNWFGGLWHGRSLAFTVAVILSDPFRATSSLIARRPKVRIRTLGIFPLL